ncbi:hypothetical protein [Listeria monocytogenes]|uniref:hypothetical protein n=1 Tax=Listeria monocytogenes TaxID=1639 RepID=UPI001E4ABEDA|nr:hypothetical protein [Listeria monocytogenes]MCD2223043.1 hypothetical protein [Listeria monocytogenes]
MIYEYTIAKQVKHGKNWRFVDNKEPPCFVQAEYNPLEQDNINLKHVQCDSNGIPVLGYYADVDTYSNGFPPLYKKTTRSILLVTAVINDDEIRTELFPTLVDNTQEFWDKIV